MRVKKMKRVKRVKKIVKNKFANALHKIARNLLSNVSKSNKINKKLIALAEQIIKVK